MKRLHLFGVCLGLIVIACGTNDGGDAKSDDSDTTSESDGDTGDGDTGDGDPGDGDGDTGDGDGDTGDGDGDGDTGDPECAAPSGPFMSYCNVPTPTCDSGFFCFIHQAEADSVEDFIGYCSPECETDADCTWGSEDQCTNEDIVCVTPEGATQARCALACETEGDCYPGQFCHGAYDLCLPVIP